MRDALARSRAEFGAPAARGGGYATWVVEVDEQTLLEAARRGDEDAFRDLVERYSRDLHLLCYRMLGSFLDAEDAKQDALLKSWRSLASFDGRSSVRTWLCRIATNTCIDLLRSRQRRVLPMDVKAPITSSWTEPSEWGQPADLPFLEPYPDAYLPEAVAEQRESISLAYIRALQLLPARQRAVLILRDALDWPAQEVAATLDTSVASVNSALQRARATTAGEAATSSRFDMQMDGRKADVASRFVDAWENGDIELLLSLLTDDAVVMMPPMLAWFQGIETLRAAFAHSWELDPRPGVFRVQAAPMNGQVGFAFWYRPRGAGPYMALAIEVLTIDEKSGRIKEMTSFVKPELFPHMGFPLSIDA